MRHTLACGVFISNEIRMVLRQTIERGWKKKGGVAILLLPLALLFAAAVNLRRLAYRLGLARAVHLSVPVVVIGNITAGGSGKTPLALYLARELASRGWHPGIVSRGYGGSIDGVEAVTPESDPARVGDEPLLLARRAGCPVFVGRDRVAAAFALLGAHCDCNVLISDDGLQHLRLGRTVEVVVADDRGFGNGWPLPSGPLRECPSHIAEAHALVLNGDAPVPPAVRPQRLFRMRLSGERFYSLNEPQKFCFASDLQGKRIHALAGIGDPGRFFMQLDRLGLKVDAHAFPDHHSFIPADLAFNDAEVLLMTEKDAVKCKGFAPPGTWVLPVEAQLEPDLAQWVAEKLDGCPPA